MRTCLTRSTSPVGLWLALVALLATPTFLPTEVSAQSFDDEFDDAFADEERESTTTTTTTTSTTLEPGDLADDEFGDTDGAAEAPPQATTRADAGAEGRATDARGDLLSSTGSRAWRHRRFALHNTWGGSVGGIHVVDAGSGPSQSFRVSLLTDFFFQNGFLGPADDHSHIGGSLGLSWTPFDFLEIYASIASYANSNQLESPRLFQVLGDTLIGVKGYVEIVPWLTVGGDLSVALLNTVGDIGLVLGSTSVGIRLNAAMDLRALEGVEIPLIARLNLQYYVDQSANLTDSVERARYEALAGATPPRQPYNNEERHLLSRQERYALGINRTDFFNIGIGVEIPIEVMPDFYIDPILEWVVSVPVNRQGYNCLFIPATPGGTTPAPGNDGCLEHQGFNAMPSTLTVGLRIQPPFRGLGITLAVDIGTSGMSSFVREIAPNAPYQVILGLSYAYDTMPPPAEVREVSVERQVEVRIPPPPRGRVMGTVVAQGTTNGVSGALVSFPGSELSTLSTAGDGRFTSTELPPGEVRMEIAHDEHHAGSCAATIPAAGGDVTVTCEIEALPAVGIVQGHVVSDAGGAVGGATVQVTGPSAFTVITSPSGEFMRQDLPPGVYTARVEAENFLITQGSFTIAPRETARPEITAIARPARSLVRLGAHEIVIRRQVNFATDSSDILPDSIGLMTEIADVLLRHPEILRLEIQGHTDNRGNHDHNQDLSQRRAEAVRTWLIGAGVDGGRLVAHGFGDTNPIAPNITAGGRARNRRVQFIIEERAPGGE